MILPLSPLYENARVARLLAEERSGVVDREADAGTRHALPPPQPRRGIDFTAERRLENGPPRAANGEETEKDVKIDGTNSVKSFRINKTVKKKNSKRTRFCIKKPLIEAKNQRITLQ
jgi:hypothetical protein